MYKGNQRRVQDWRAPASARSCLGGQFVHPIWPGIVAVTWCELGISERSLALANLELASGVGGVTKFSEINTEQENFTWSNYIN